MDSDDPITATVVGATVVSTGLSVYGSLNQGAVQGDTARLNSQLRAKELRDQAVMSENEALIFEREAMSSEYGADAEREATAWEVAQAARQGETFQAQQRAEIAGSGLEASGSPLIVMSETAKQLELDRLAMTHAGEVRARGMEDEARMSRYGAQLSRYQAEQLRRGIPLQLELGRYQARAARQQAQLQATSSIISGGARGFTAYYGSRA